MKKVLYLTLVCFMLSLSANAQKTTTKIMDTQARLLDMVSDGYVKPLTVELKIIEKEPGKDPKNEDQKGPKIEDHHFISMEKFEALRRDPTNIRSWAIYQSSQKHHADVIVAPTFIFQNATNKDTGEEGFDITVIGFPAVFCNWHTMTNADIDWISLEKTQNLKEIEKIKPVIRK